MKFVINKILLFSLMVLTQHVSAIENAETKIIKRQIIESGFKPADELYRNSDEKLSPLGVKFFESNKGLSLNGNISCRTCHQDKFGSADGIPNAAAIGGGDGKTMVGPDRLLNGAKQLPRNTLAFWGRGAKGFDVFFWDGRVDFSLKKPLSQFGSQGPTNDALVTAIHLPVVEIREMLDEDQFVKNHKTESVDKSKEVYKAISQRLIKIEPEASQNLAKVLNKNVDQLEYIDFARAIAAFIRNEFRLKQTKLERFVQGKEDLTQPELKGARVFYGKGACSTCHNGPHFSDFKFYTVPFPQLGFGKNGFGVDYGRYNATFNPKDLYKFRTAPLYNVEKTAPYGHSGSVATIQEAIIAHYDPLSLVQTDKLSQFDRYELSKRLTFSDSTTRVNYLTPEEVSQLTAFLKTLSF
ncbi:methylamine utilization protein MauG [Polynucleobacter sp. SHI8]|uniref:His-Xaa-Ser system-associated MauG-like protein n=1 Tax=unclassified Polynucleobacter TaxID=2640945 RepID=UPI002491B976|nr:MULTISPECIES: His-Xaa-Ser system-associated MauG-like protein [unclassified Polynucleobacter]BDW12334.1 methylamine utilization protein MauG [Polynucleobacter sp. SHI2]BDW14782.1 methylamine utilization protein MauG [Polynucleobacter sp. SHI8]